jgi:hypothetical protein
MIRSVHFPLHTSHIILNDVPYLELALLFSRQVSQPQFVVQSGSPFLFVVDFKISEMISHLMIIMKCLILPQMMAVGSAFEIMACRWKMFISAVLPS